MTEHRQGGQQYDKMAGQPQRRSRQREDESDQETPPPKKSKTGKGKSLKKITDMEKRNEMD